jgi:hypothetical protein
MLFEGYINQEKNNVELYEIDKIKNFNQQIAKTIEEKIETVQYELLDLSDMLMKHGYLIQ